MRKLLIFIFLAFFGFPAYAGFGPQNPTSPAGGAPSSPCPSWYADTNVRLSWDGDHKTSNVTGCDNAGNPKTFTLTGGDIDAYGVGGSNALRCDAISEYMRYTQTAGQYADFTRAQTICLKIKVYGTFDNGVYFTYITDTSANDRIRCYINVGAYTVNCDWDTEGHDPVGAGGDTIPAETWATIAYTWDEANDNHGPNPGDGAPGWQDGWEIDNETINAMTDNVIYIFFGTNPQVGALGDGKYYYIDSFALVDSYQFDCSTLTGW